MEIHLIRHSYHIVRVEKNTTTASYNKYEYALKTNDGRFEFLEFSHIIELNDIIPGSDKYDTIGCQVLKETRHKNKDSSYVTILSDIMITHSDYYITSSEMSRPPIHGFKDCFIIMETCLKSKYPPSNSFVNFWDFRKGFGVLARNSFDEYIDRFYDEYLERSEIVDNFTQMLITSKCDGSTRKYIHFWVENIIIIQY
jgi:hypothetical protein